MKTKHHSISIHFARMVVKSAKNRGLDYKLLLKNANISENLLNQEQIRVTAEQFSKLMSETWSMGDDEFLGMASQPTRHGVFTLMAKQAVHCLDLNAIYRHLAYFYNLITPALSLSFHNQTDEAAFSMFLTQPEKDSDHALREFLMLLWHRFPSWLIGKRIPLKRIHLDYSEPRHKSEYRLLYPCPARFSQSDCRLIFDAKYLQERVVRTPKELRAYLRRAPLDWFSRQAFYPLFTQRVVSYLEQASSVSNINMQSMARKLHMTTRTLRRKLTAENTNFQQLKDNVRRDMAINYLSQPNIRISQISNQLGFSEPAAFTRAFKQWTGVSPRDYRR